MNAVLEFLKQANLSQLSTITDFIKERREVLLKGAFKVGNKVKWSNKCGMIKEINPENGTLLVVESGGNFKDLIVKAEFCEKVILKVHFVNVKWGITGGGKGTWDGMLEDSVYSLYSPPGPVVKGSIVKTILKTVEAETFQEAKDVLLS